jgi:hypothetical protein
MSQSRFAGIRVPSSALGCVNQPSVSSPSGRLHEMYGPPPRRKRKVRVTGWSAQMYAAFFGVDYSWPGWNALRSVPIQLGSLGRLLPSSGFENAGFDRCAILMFASRPGRKSKNLVVAGL